MIAVRIGEVRRLLVASPDYLAHRGTPVWPEDLKAHDLIALTGLMPGKDWKHATEDGRVTTMSFRPRLRVNDAAGALAAAERGEGISVALSYMVQPLLAAGRLVPLLDAFAPPPEPIHVVYPQPRVLSPKVRAFVDFAVPRLRQQLGPSAAEPSAGGPNTGTEGR